MTSEPEPLWSGCHGVRLGPDDIARAYGTSSGVPFLDAVLEAGTVPSPTGRQIWHLSGTVSTPAGDVRYDQRLTIRHDGVYVVRTGDASLSVDPSKRHLVIDAERESLGLQLVTTYGLPLVLQGEPVLVLHACAAVPPGGRGASIVCGASGTGKSSLLTGLIEAGWTAVSEDVCSVDLRPESPVVWPGPPWLRRAGAGPGGPIQSGARFTTPDKTAWDIAAVQVRAAVPVERIVFLEPSGGDEIERRDVQRSEAIGRLARATVWLLEPERRAAGTFGPCVRVASSVVASRLRMPRSDDWVAGAESVLRESF